MNSRLTRTWLRDLLERWRAEEFTAADVHGMAEQLWDSSEWPNLPDSDPRAIEVEVLSQLEILNYQLITRDDIPALLAFLDTQAGSEREGWNLWMQYWEGIDFEKRAAALRGDSFYVV